MVPTPQKLHKTGELKATHSSSGDRIVISGISGLYANISSIKELADVLYNKRNPIKKETRWSCTYPEITEYTGNVPKLQYFDAQFFKVQSNLAMNMDPMARKLHELTYQAIYDSGTSPEQLSGNKVGVFLGASFLETETLAFFTTKHRSGSGLVGCSKSMFANRLSYAFNFKGPSMVLDSNSSSSEMALQLACQSMARGDCEAAIVGGASLCMHPQGIIQFGRIIPLCMDGKTKSFDKNADGLTKSEAINIIFLQKAQNAKRIYAYIVDVNSKFINVMSDVSDMKVGFYQDPVEMSKFLREFYKNNGIPTQAVEYVEAVGSADPAADKAELQSFAEVFCEDRIDPLLVGSVTSNIGYTDAAHGISGITKVLLGYHTGTIAANLHFEKPRDDIKAIKEGRLRIVSEHKPFKSSYAAINGISTNGIITHVLLQGHYKPKDLRRYKTTLPRLVNISARQDTFVTKIIKDLKSRPIDPEEIALLHNIHGTKILGHLGRGYCILDTDPEEKTVCLSETVTYYDETRKPLWFVYSGMGSQWAGMGAQLIRIPVFAAAIKRCQKILQPKGIDIVHIITSPDSTIFNNILHSFVGIAAIQIGLTDVLKSVGIEPDMVIGHSVGELGCAYADGCLTAEEMILSAYSRGLVSLKTSFIQGSMAAVGIGFKQISKMLPPDIEVACHNGPDSSTISGPADKMKEFVSELTANGIFAKEVPCSNIAYHSRYIAKAGPVLLKYLKDVIKDPKPRSERWASTSIPKSRWHEPIAKFSSAEYHTNNLLSPVLFEETARLIPANAVVVEVAPHSLLQAILKRSLPSSCKNIALTRRGHPDNAFLLLDAIGKLFVEGYNPRIEELYPKVEFPVSTRTPMLSHLVEWVHIENWSITFYAESHRKKASAYTFFVSLHEDEYMNLQGNIIKDKTLFPFAAALVAAWDTLAMSLNQPKRNISVEFSDIHLYTQPILLKQRPLKIHVMLSNENGRFEVTNDDSVIVTGCLKTSNTDISKVQFSIPQEEDLEITSDSIYKIFAQRDFQYQGDFRTLFRVNPSLTEAKIIWNNDWITFLDGILQFITLRRDKNHISQPYEIRRMHIDVLTHLENDEMFEDKIIRTAKICALSSAVRCGGIFIEDIKCRDLNLYPNEIITLKSLNVPGLNYHNNVLDIFTTTKGSTLTLGKVGDLNSLKWVSMIEKLDTGIEVKVNYAAVCDLDVKTANGIILFNCERKPDSSFGMDFSGVTESGERVMGLLPHGSLQERVKAIPEALWLVPEYWSLEDAATVPSAYMLALYCLVIKSEYVPGMKILVHGGAGALGQAVLSIALAHKSEVFTTVSDFRKKEFLLKLFPELKEDHIGNSRDASFGDMIKLATKNGGVHIVIGCVKSELKNISLACGGFMNVFLDLGQNLTNENFHLGLDHLSCERNYKTVNFHSIFEEANREELKKLQQILCAGIKAGYVRPLTRVTYTPENVPRAFRLLAASRHRGRVLIKTNNVEVLTQPRLVCNPEKVQVVICSDILGSRWADHLVSRGARNLMMHCISVSAYLQLKIRSWQKIGVKVKVSSTDLSTTEGVINYINESQQMGKIEGIFIIVTHRNADVNNVNEVLENIDFATRKLETAPEYFGILSANKNIGQKICVSRIQNDLPTTLLDVSGRTHITTNTMMGSHETMTAFENALLSTKPMLVAESQKIPDKTLLQDIAQVAGLVLPEDIEDSFSLKDLGVQPDRLPVLVSSLMDEHHISLTQEEVANLTVKKIKEIGESFSEPEFKDTHGLEAFFSNVIDDELLATAESIFLPTRTNSAAGRDNHFEATQTYMCLVPGLEGHFGRFTDLCRQLKLPAIVVQHGLDYVKESFNDRALRHTKTLLKKTRLINNKFYLLGYETGVIVALKMAEILEEQGFTGTVFCVGGTPEEILAKIEAETAFDHKELQFKVARHMTSLITGKDIELETEEALEGESWVAPFVHALRKHGYCSLQYTRALIEGAYEIIISTKAQKLYVKPLKSRLILIRASDVGLMTSPESLIQNYSQQPVEVVTLPTPLVHLTKDLRCSALVNKNLEPDLLVAFNESNLCDSYLINADIFEAK